MPCGRKASPRGLSPRGRGKRHILNPPAVSDRSIPAWAGETPLAGLSVAPWRVYPRVGGGNQYIVAGATSGSGLSPRGRGKPPLAVADAGVLGSIPAWAGETPSIKARPIFSAVYPRVGGGNVIPLLPSRAMKGLSPRGRGKRRAERHHADILGSIPAWAGETPTSRRLLMSETVYPRVGGGNF